MRRYVAAISVLLSFLPVMMAIQIITGTWSWPYQDTVSLSTKLNAIAMIGGVSVFWNMMNFLFWSTKSFGEDPK